ncbi:MAG TPA: hypothetical protein VJB66_03635 [Candidatus Nanoarchaeia archaeon]|nr:hypothetical protein [Candidatus Nanoarchaeia archaeon]
MDKVSKYKDDKLLWLTEERQDLVDKHRGEWVALDIEHDKVFAHDKLDVVINLFEKEHPGEIPHVFRIPTKDEELCVYGFCL